MGFLTPGKSSRKRSKEHKANVERVKKAKRASSSTSPSVSPPQTRQTTPETVEVVAEEEPIPEQPPASILERLPVELIHKIFIFAGLNSLPFVCKSLNAQLAPCLSLKVRMLRNYVHNLNSQFTEEPSCSDYRIQTALDKSVLNYRFLSHEVLFLVRADTILSLEAIHAEAKNRLILHCDKISKAALDLLKNNTHIDDQITVLLAGLAKAREKFGLEDSELSDVALDQAQDFPEKFYNAPFGKKKLLLIEELRHKGMMFIDGGKVLKNAISSGCDIATIGNLLMITETGQITDSQPLIAAFERDDLELAAWILSECEDELAMVNDDDLWIYLSRHQNTDHLNFVQQRGGVPSHEILGSLAVGFGQF